MKVDFFSKQETCTWKHSIMTNAPSYRKASNIDEKVITFLVASVLLKAITTFLEEICLPVTEEMLGEDWSQYRIQVGHTFIRIGHVLKIIGLVIFTLALTYLYWTWAIVPSRV